jgi:short chain dehydrogenase
MAGRLQGKRVVVTDASEFMGPDVVALFREEGGEVIADVRDLRQPGASEALILEAGHVEVLMVNLAGASSGKALGEVQDAELDMLLDRQVRPLHRLTRAVLPQMLARRKGKIVVVGSATGLRGQPRRAAYSAARAAQHGYVRSVGAERGVRCERDCDRANLRGEPDLLSAELPGDRGFQAAHARRAGRAALDGARGGHVPAGPRRAGERLDLRPSVSLRRRLGDLNPRQILEGAPGSLQRLVSREQLIPNSRDEAAVHQG